MRMNAIPTSWIMPLQALRKVGAVILFLAATITVLWFEQALLGTLLGRETRDDLALDIAILIWIWIVGSIVLGNVWLGFALLRNRNEQAFRIQFGTELQQSRKELGVARDALARLANIPEATIEEIEEKRSVLTAKALGRIADVL